MSAPNMEQNKIFGALLLAGIVAMLAGFIASQFMPEEHLKEDAYPIEIAEASASGAPAPVATAAPITDLIATADMAKGQKLTKACMACHSFNQGGPNKIGPNLWGVYNATKASKDFPYSAGMETAGGSWDTASLNTFLWKPKKAVPGTKMNYPGMKKPEDRAAVVKYLQSLK